MQPGAGHNRELGTTEARHNGEVDTMGRRTPLLKFCYTLKARARLVHDLHSLSLSRSLYDALECPAIGYLSGALTH